MEDVYWSIAWLAASWTIVRSCFVVAQRQYPHDSAWQVVLHTAVLAVSVVIVSLTVTGALGLISPLMILVMPVLLSGALRMMNFAPSASIDQHKEPAGAKWLWAAVGGLIAGHSIVNGILGFPDDYDCLMYHLPLINSWIQSGSLACMQSPRWSDSANSELLGLWLVGVFSGDFLVAFNNLPVMLVWILGLLEFGRLVGLTGWNRHFVTVAAIAVYTTVHETDDASNDLMVVAFFVAAAAYALRYRRSRCHADRLLFALCLGVLAGTKFFATGYALLLGILFACISFESRNLRRIVGDSVVSIGISLLAGGYWYVRNFWITGHVFYPKGAVDLHERITHPDLAKTTLAFNGDPQVPSLLMDAVWRLCGPLHYALILLLPTIVAVLCIRCWLGWKSTPSQTATSGITLFLLLSTGLIALTTPMLVEDQPNTLNHLRWGYTPVRYSLCFLTMLILAAGIQIQTISDFVPRLARKGLMALLLTASVWQLVMRFWSRTELDMETSVFAGLLLILLLRLAFELWRHSGIARAACLLAMVLGLPMLTGWTSQRWHAGLAEHFDVFYRTRFFTELRVQPEPMLVLDERSYAYFGSRRENFVLHVASYRNVDQVRSLMQEYAIPLVVTRIDQTPQKISRYRPAWEELEAAADFRLEHDGHELQVWRWVKQSPADDAPGK